MKKPFVCPHCGGHHITEQSSLIPKHYWIALSINENGACILEINQERNSCISTAALDYGFANSVEPLSSDLVTAVPIGAKKEDLLQFFYGVPPLKAFMTLIAKNGEYEFEGTRWIILKLENMNSVIEMFEK